MHNQQNNYQAVNQDLSNFNQPLGSKTNIASPMQQKYFQMSKLNLKVFNFLFSKLTFSVNQKDNYRVNNIDNIGVNSSNFNYSKFNKKVFDHYQNYESYNFHKQTKPIEKDFAVNKNPLENIYNKDASDYKAVINF